MRQQLVELRMLSSVREGVEWTQQTCIVILQVVIGLMLVFSATKTVACRFVQFTLGHSHSRVMKLATSYLGTGVLPSIVHRQRGPIPVRAEEFSADYQRAIVAQLDAWSDQGVAVTGRIVQEFMESKYGVRLSVR